MELLLSPIILGPLCLVLGALLGVGLGRRSKTANEYYDRARAAWDLREAQLRDALAAAEEKINELKAKGKG